MRYPIRRVLSPLRRRCRLHLRGGYGLPPADDLPAGWYRIGLATMKCDVEVELLENWRTHPIPTPITADRLYGGIARDHTREAVKPRSNPRFKSPSAKAQAQTALRERLPQHDRQFEVLGRALSAADRERKIAPPPPTARNTPTRLASASTGEAGEGKGSSEHGK